MPEKMPSLRYIMDPKTGLYRHVTETVSAPVLPDGRSMIASMSIGHSTPEPLVEIVADQEFDDDQS